MRTAGCWQPAARSRRTLVCLVAGSMALCWGSVARAQDLAALRKQLVDEEVEGAGISNRRVLDAMRATPRHEFVPAGFRQHAYRDAALPIGEQQTISPPFVVAYMTEQLDPQPGDRVLEIGTGSGYQAAVLSPLVDTVYTIEIVKRLGERAARTLRRLGYDNVHVRVGDGFAGWPEHAPFDKIIVTCSPEKVPQPLIDQLAEEGQMIVPVGERYRQNLFRLTKRDGQLVRESLRATLFVPMTGAAETARELHPDPARPTIFNGGFEKTLGSENEPLGRPLPGHGLQPAGWHYLRQAEVTVAEDAPQGQSYLTFRNQQPGRASRALQGLAIDGRQVTRVRLSLAVRGEQIRSGPTPEQLPAAVLTFYDSRRAVIDSQSLGPWQGDFAWRVVKRQLTVPLAAREAIVRLGLLGGVGRLDVDNLQLVVIGAE